MRCALPAAIIIASLDCFPSTWIDVTNRTSGHARVTAARTCAKSRDSTGADELTTTCQPFVPQVHLSLWSFQFRNGNNAEASCTGASEKANRSTLMARYRFSVANTSPVACSTFACRLLPCASIVTMAMKPFTRRCHMASGMPNSNKCTPSTFSTVRA